MKYHGVIESYIFEYKLSTDTNWTTVPTQNSAEYTFEGLTGGKSYNLRVTVTDQAGNSSTDTNTASTDLCKDITDITSDSNIPKAPFKGISLGRSGRTLDLTITGHSVAYPSNYSGEVEIYEGQTISKWYILFETAEILAVTALRE